MFRPGIFVALLALVLAPSLARAETPAEALAAAKRVVFLGDSITAAGGYVGYFEAWLLTQKRASLPHIIDVGLPSETVSGLSEEGHAGGKFPRPDLAERLDRVLAATKPDLIFACYGMNCGIYLPFDEARFAKYQAGIKHLRAQAEKIGAKVIHITPPFYDDARAPKDFAYDDVLARYSDWLLDQRKAGWMVVDLHGPMKGAVLKQRETAPTFTLQPDGVHPSDAGHWLIAQELIVAFGDESVVGAETPAAMLSLFGQDERILPLVMRRMSVLRDAYVSAAGHKRPGVAAGLPVDDAEAQAAELTKQIAALKK